MTKSQQILRLYDGSRTTSEIAAIVGCLPEYVRVVARQRPNGIGSTQATRKWLATKGLAHKRRRYATDPEYRERRKRIVRESKRRVRLRKRNEAIQ